MRRIVWSYMVGVTAGLGTAWALSFVWLYVFVTLFVGEGEWSFSLVGAVSLAVAGYVSAWQTRSPSLRRSLVVGASAGFTASLIILLFTTGEGKLGTLVVIMGFGVATSLFGALFGARHGAKQCS